MFNKYFQLKTTQKGQKCVVIVWDLGANTKNQQNSLGQAKCQAKRDEVGKKEVIFVKIVPKLQQMLTILGQF